MRDLYALLGLGSPESTKAEVSEEALRSAIEGLPVGSELRDAAEFILLDPGRREAYDKERRTLRLIGQLRVHFRSVPEDWQQPGLERFIPSGGLLKGKARRRASKADRYRLWIQLGMVAFALGGALLAFWMAFSRPPPTAPLPAPGIVDVLPEMRSRLPAERPLALDASQASVNIWVEFFDENTRSLAWRAFIPAGSIVDLSLPSSSKPPKGVYAARISGGESWHGPLLGFERSARWATFREWIDLSCSEADDCHPLRLEVRSVGQTVRASLAAVAPQVEADPTRR